MNLRPGVRVDLDPLLDLWERLSRTGEEADPRYAMAPDAREIARGLMRDTWFIDKPFPRVIVAEDGGRLAGYVQGPEITPSPLFRFPRVARIGDLWVEPEYRRQGLGTRLVDAWFANARAAGIERFEVTTLVRDARAVAFWRSQGFGEWTVVMVQAASV